jgi:cytochrome c
MDERIFIGERIRDLYQADNGDFVLWTDSGKIIFLTPLKEQTRVEKMISALSPAARDEIRGCKECHVFEPGSSDKDKINLYGIVGRARASTSYDAYSEALKGKGGRWDRVSLDAFLKNPQKAIPGTSMSVDGIMDDKTRKEVLDFLEKLR